MMRIVTSNVYFRPIMSPMRPNTRAPNGRMMKPAEKARRAKIRPVVGSVFEKNKRPTIGAIAPKRMKSYHSNTVPMQDAAMILISSLVKDVSTS